MTLLFMLLYQWTLETCSRMETAKLINLPLLPTQMLHQSKSKTQKPHKRLLLLLLKSLPRRKLKRKLRKILRKLRIQSSSSQANHSLSPMLLALEDFINKSLMMMLKRRRKPGRRLRQKQVPILMRTVTQLSKSQLLKLVASEWTSLTRMVLDM